MNKIFFLFIILIALGSIESEALGVGVSPGKLSLGNIRLNIDYEKELIIINPNDFDIEFFIESPENVQTSPKKGYIAKGKTKKIDLTITFTEIKNKDEILLLNIIRKDAPNQALAMLPGIAVALEYDYSPVNPKVQKVQDEQIIKTEKYVFEPPEIENLQENDEEEVMQIQKPADNQQKLDISNKQKYDDDMYKVPLLDKMVVLKIGLFLLIAVLLIILFGFYFYH
ncbi:MAG: hypothetical protein U9R34_06480 [Nanoarchaeota archaeon]|nr:hypothetical protein [Nanoarchaeota archaeon]